MIRILMIGFITLLSLNAYAESESDDPMLQTQALLKNKGARDQMIQKDQKAKMADDHVKSLGLSGDKQEELYELSGDIFKTLVDGTGGDANKLNEKMQKYLRDPSQIEKDLTPSQKQKIHELSQELPQSKKTALESGYHP